MLALLCFALALLWLWFGFGFGPLFLFSTQAPAPGYSTSVCKRVFVALGLAVWSARVWIHRVRASDALALFRWLLATGCGLLIAHCSFQSSHSFILPCLARNTLQKLEIG
jgi:hypothetical protein